MMGENVKKETVDYLPLGSVVILKGGVQKVVVIAGCDRERRLF